MSRAIDFHPDAADEAVAAQHWYHEVDARLGTDFKHELGQALARIADAPERWSRHLYGTRCFLLRRFPYLVIYLPTEVQVQVIAVQHVKRRPGYWKERLR